MCVADHHEQNADRQQSVTGVIAEDVCVSPQSASPFREPNDTCRQVQWHLPLSPPFTAVIEYVTLPITPGYFCGTDNFL